MARRKPPAPPVRQLISLPAEWRDAFRAAAERDGMSLSAWLRDAGAAQLPKTVRAKLPQPSKSGPQPRSA